MLEDEPKLPWEIDHGRGRGDAEFFQYARVSRASPLAAAILSWYYRLFSAVILNSFGRVMSHEWVCISFAPVGVENAASTKQRL
jgi:hypothetical protein